MEKSIRGVLFIRVENGLSDHTFVYSQKLSTSELSDEEICQLGKGFLFDNVWLYRSGSQIEILIGDDGQSVNQAILIWKGSV